MRNLKHLRRSVYDLSYIHLLQSTLHCRHIVGARVTIFVLGRRFWVCGGLGQGNICRGGRGGVEKCAMRKSGSPFCPNPLPVKDPITRCGIENLVYRAFRSKITPALQATLKVSFNAL